MNRRTFFLRTVQLIALAPIAAKAAMANCKPANLNQRILDTLNGRRPYDRAALEAQGLTWRCNRLQSFSGTPVELMQHLVNNSTFL